MSINIIVAISKNNCIGKDGTLPWHIPADMKRVKELTTGKNVVMGRNTWESIPEKYRPLPNRKNIVITRTLAYSVPEGVEVYTSITEAIEAHKGEDIVGFGGQRIFEEMLPLADILYITHVDQVVEECDAFFPKIDLGIWQETERENFDGFSFVTYEKIKERKGKFIVIYGINNLGKTTQAKKLVERLNTLGHKTEYIKYPIYNLAPTGSLINAYLREGNPHNLSSREVQILYTLNRDQHQPNIIKMLSDGINIIAEDYVGTGLAWGIGQGVSEEFLLKINSHLTREDLVFLIDGARFLESKESNHKHESDNKLMEEVRNIHLRLAKERDWKIINANDSIESIHEKIFSEVIGSVP